MVYHHINILLWHAQAGVTYSHWSNVADLVPYDDSNRTSETGFASFDWSLARLRIPSKEFGDEWCKDQFGAARPLLSAVVVGRTAGKTDHWDVKMDIDGTVYSKPEVELPANACCPWRMEQYMVANILSGGTMGTPCTEQVMSDTFRSIMEHHNHAHGTNIPELMAGLKKEMSTMTKTMELSHSENYRQTFQKAVLCLTNTLSSVISNLSPGGSDPVLEELKEQLDHLKAKEWKYIQTDTGEIAEIIREEESKLTVAEISTNASLCHRCIPRTAKYRYITQEDALDNSADGDHMDDVRRMVHLQGIPDKPAQCAHYAHMEVNDPPIEETMQDLPTEGNLQSEDMNTNGASSFFVTEAVERREPRKKRRRLH